MFLFMCYHCGSPKSWKYFRLLTPVKEEATSTPPVTDSIEKQQTQTIKVDDNWGVDSSDAWGDSDDWGTEENKSQDTEIEQLINSTSQQLQELSLTPNFETPIVNTTECNQVISINLDNNNNNNNNNEENNKNDSDNIIISSIDDKKDELYFGWNWIAVEEDIIPTIDGKEYKNVEVARDEEWGGEEYEKVRIHDKYFSKFLKQLSYNEEQLLRYEFKGNPLFLYEHKEIIPKCPECGKQRVFELQIMPNFITYLSQHIEDRSNKYQMMSIGSIFLYSCSADCVPKNCKEEKVPIEQYLIEEYLVIQDSV